MRRAQWLCALLAATAAPAILLGCGTSRSAGGAETTTLPAASSTSLPPSSPTSSSAASNGPAGTLAPTSLAVQYGQDACRAFESFAAVLAGQAEDGPTAVGEISGMVVEAEQAHAASGDHRWVSLVNDLKALQAVAGSKQWPRTPTAAKLPQVKQVAADCQPIGVG